MDEKGFIFTMDAALMLIPIFIIAATVSGLSLNVAHESPYYQSQDIMETLYNIANTPSDISLTSLANNITAGANITTLRGYANDNRFKQILDKSGRNYNLTYNSTATDFTTLVSKGDMQNAPNAASVTRIYNGVTFRLYMW